jgi:amidase
MTRLGSRPHPHILTADMSLGAEGPAVAVKDCLDIAGYPTGCGSRAFADALPAAQHSDVVRDLLAAGCRIIGKANMHELAYGVTGLNGWTGTPENPAFPDYVPGGSSSGSAAAVAAGMAAFAIGTDTGGSIRVPAACCGVYGLKPSFGLISRRGAHPSESSLDCIGPLAAGIDGIVAAMEIIAPGFRASHLSAARLGMVATTADPLIEAALRAAVQASGTETRDVLLSSLGAAFEAGLLIMGDEMARQFGSLCGSGKLGADVENRLVAAKAIGAADVERAEEVRRRFTSEVDAALDHVDALVLPTLPAAPVRLDQAGDATAALAMTALVRPFNLSGHPALAIPLTAKGGIPAGLQLIGRNGEESRLCAIARLFEGTRGA